MAKNRLNESDVRLWKKIADSVDYVLPSSKLVAAKGQPLFQKKPPPPLPKQPHLSSSTSIVKPTPVILQPANLDGKNYGGISGSMARSIKSGQAGYTDSIDLHGTNRIDAYVRLKRFILDAALDGHRHVLVITGKGSANKGVIKSSLPIWLNEPPLAAYVIAFCQAKPKDGGSGAWYVNLRRRP